MSLIVFHVSWRRLLTRLYAPGFLFQDLAGLAGAHGVSDVWIRLSFPDNFPFSPPFLRVLAPNIQGGFVLSGGAICMELLTPDGWSSAYTVEAIIHQTMSMMVKVRTHTVLALVSLSCPMRPVGTDAATRLLTHSLSPGRSEGCNPCLEAFH